MPTTSKAVKVIAEETGWKESDIRNRARWLVRDGRLPKGRPGPKGGADLTARHLVLLLLSLACPEGKRSSEFVLRFAGLLTTDGEKEWTLMEALLDRIDAFHKDERLPNQDYRLDRVLLIFKEGWPIAEMDFVRRDTTTDGRGFPDARLVFAEGVDGEGPNVGLAEMFPAVVINGGVIIVVSDLLEGDDG